MPPNAHYISQSTCLYFFAFGNCHIFQFAIHPTHCCLSYLYKAQTLFFSDTGTSQLKVHLHGYLSKPFAWVLQPDILYLG